MVPIPFADRYAILLPLWTYVGNRTVSIKVNGVPMNDAIGLFSTMNGRWDRNMVPFRDIATTGEVMGRMQG
ncbi:MAG: hypothetical protein PVS3B3_07660 [Ktedonobacteraceae bacterium]